MAVPDNALGIGVRTDVSPAAHSLASSAPEHFVQFYREDEELIGSVAKYVREGMEGGAAAVVIAAEPHTTALEERLRADGIDTAKARRGRQLLLLDAGETLATFMVDGVPDRELFLAKVGGIISAAIGRHGRVLAFGEMVALLWAEGKGDAAIALERLWNSLAARHSFSLHCAYPLHAFSHHSQTEQFLKVCAEHSSVIPAEGFAQLRSSDAHERTIVELRFFDGLTQSEIAERVGISQMHVSRLLARSLNTLRDAAEA